MLPLPAAVAISQIAALMGIEAVRHIVMAIASLIKDIDFRLMYEQDVFQKARYFKRFSTTKTKKNVALFFSAIALVIYFLPTLVAIQGNMPGTEYSYSRISKKERPTGLYARHEDLVFKELIKTKTKGEVNSTTAILENHLIVTNRNTTTNPSGIWYTVHENVANTKRWEEDERYPPIKPSMLKKESSGALEQCIDSNDPGYSTNLVTGFSNIEGHRVQAVRAYNHTCYPIADNTLSLFQAVYEKSYNQVNSVVENNDENFRSPFMHEHTSASVPADASLIYIGGDRISMLIKKKTHITVFYDNANSSLCKTPSNNAQDSLPYDQDIDSIVCQLTELAAQTPTLLMFQATRRTIENNKLVNSVYTYIKKPEGGHGIMIDLTSISAFLIIKKGRISSYSYDREVLFAHQVIKRQEWQLTTNYGALLQEMDVFPSVDTTYGQNTWTDLALVTSSLQQGKYYEDFFIKYTATVTPTLAIPSSWLIVSCVLFAVFAIIIVIASMMTPRMYKTDLRKLLLSTIQHSLKTKSSSNVVAEDGATEMNDRISGKAIASDHDGRVDDLYASVLKYGEENKDKNQLFTMDGIPVVPARKTGEGNRAPEEA